MQKHLEEIGRTVRAGAHAILLLDRAGWHTTDKRNLPSTLTLLPLPPVSPELNAAENIWQYLRQTYLSKRVFEADEDISDAGGQAWCAMRAEAGRIKSIASRSRASIEQTLSRMV
jgi:transposase